MENVSSVLRAEESEEYAAISEFKKYFKEGNLQEEEVDDGKFIFFEQQPLEAQDGIIDLLRSLNCTQNIGMIQFWAVVKVEGQQSQYYLSTKHQPFSVCYPNKSVCRYRNRCNDYVYDGGAAEEEDDEHRGAVRRAYLNKRPESTPDLMLYNTEEFSMRDDAKRCGFRSLLAVPLLDFITNRCYGVLELLSRTPLMTKNLLSSLDSALQKAKTRSTHTSPSTNKPKHRHTEITEALEWAINAIPGSYLAVWVPCKQCPNKSTNLCCMERAAFINSQNALPYDADMLAYLQACEFHKQQIDLGRIHQNSCDLTISQNPLLHYALKARLPLCHPIYLKAKHDNNDSCVVELFPCGDFSLPLLLSIMEVKLENFEVAREEQLPKQLVQPYATECESINMMKVMDFKEEFSSEQDFTEYFGTVELCGTRLPPEGSDNGWVFCRPARAVKEKIQLVLNKIAVKFMTGSYSMVQFWAPTEVEGKCYLETSHQPYALGFLAKGLASFRKECMKHKYCVEDNAKKEELGPPGRVFKNGLPEISPDVSFYSNADFFLRKYALHCGFSEYFALPVFDDDKDKCFGVLELIGFSYHQLYSIKGELEAVKLSSALVDSSPRFLANKDRNINLCREAALVELRDLLNLIRSKSHPQLYSANVWVPREECVGSNTNTRCMELALCSKSTSEFMPKDGVRWVHVQPKKGFIGTVLASESQACFCPNLRGFNIADQPLSHFDINDRRDVCFAICLQSSHSGDLVYVVELCLNPAAEEYLLDSFLNFLVPKMKQKLNTFKMASGKQLGAEFDVEVVEFSESSEPVKSRSVPYGQKGDQYRDEQQQVESVSDAKQGQGCSEALNLSLLQNDAVQNSAATCGSKNTKRLITMKDIEQHYGKKTRQEVADLNSVSLSTVHRFLYENNIRWPKKRSRTKSTLLSEGESDLDTLNDFQPSSSNNHLQMEESSQHVIVQEGAEKVIVKVTYLDTIRFEFCLSLGKDKLYEEVATKFNLQPNTFKLKYIDEENEEMLVCDDADLQSCPKTQTAKGKTCIRFFIRLH